MLNLPPLPDSNAIMVTLPRHVLTRAEALDVLKNFGLAGRPVTLSFKMCSSVTVDALDTLVEAILVSGSALSLTAHAPTSEQGAILLAAAQKYGFGDKFFLLRSHVL